MSIEPEKQPDSSDLLPHPQRRALVGWDVVSDLSDTSYILNNGAQLGGGSSMGAHAKIADFAMPNEKNPFDAFLSTGAIRFYKDDPSTCDIELMREPTASQIEVLKRAAMEFPVMQVDLMDGEGRLIKNYSRQRLGAIMQDMRRVLRAMDIK